MPIKVSKVALVEFTGCLIADVYEIVVENFISISYDKLLAALIINANFEVPSITIPFIANLEL